MTLSFTGRLDRTTVLRAADLVAALIERPEVRRSWERESACAGMSVGGLTWHLAKQSINIVRLIEAGQPAPAGAETIELLEHYVRAAWVSEDQGGEANRSIRETANTDAAEGTVDAAVAAVAVARGALDAVLADAPATVFVPWQGWALATDDFLVTRLMEMVVHADDLAASVDVPTPDFGLAVLDPVVRLLAVLALKRHGQDALVRTLSRPQRAPATVSAF